MSEEGTGGGGGDGNRSWLRILAWCAGGVLILLGIIVFLVWVILRPSKPSFNLQDIRVYTFNVSTTPPYSITTNMQVTLASTNPNSLIGVEYQPLDLYATYRDQQVTTASLLPPTYQGHKETVVWSPFLNGNVPISPYAEQSLAQDLNVGAVLMDVKLKGDVKFKVGVWISGKYNLYVHCPSDIRFGNMIINGGIAVAPRVIEVEPVHCTVEVAA